MKKMFLLLLMISAMFSVMYAVTIHSESFETETGYTVFYGFTDGIGDYFVRTNGIDVNVPSGMPTYSSSNADFFFAAEDTEGSDNPNPDGTSWIEITGIDITGYSNLQIKGLFACGAKLKFDPEDYMHIFVNIDDAGYVKIGAFEADIATGYNSQNFGVDADLDGLADGPTYLNTTFSEYAFDFGVTGSTINIKVEVYMTSGDEEIAFDYIQVTDEGGGGSNIPPTITNIITDPAAPTSIDDVTIFADINDLDGTITSAKCSWGFTNDNLATEITMSIQEKAGYYTITDIPAQTAGTTVYYQIEAIDNEPDTTYSAIKDYTIPTNVTIYDIQYTVDPTGNSPYLGQTVSTNGIVTAVRSDSYFIQNGAGAWNGIYVYAASAPTIGDDVTVTAEVDEYNNLTELKDLTSYVVNSSGNALPSAAILTTLAVVDEQYEGVLVQVQNAECTNADLGYGEWEVNDGSGACRIDDHFYAYTPTLGTNYDVTGPLYYGYGAYKIEPRDAADIVPQGDLVPPTIISVSVTDGNTVEVNFSEDVEEITAETTTNYTIVAREVAVTGAVLDVADATHVTLTVTGMVYGNYTLSAVGVEDLNGNPSDDNENFSYTETVIINPGDIVINEVGEPYDMPGTWGSSYIELFNTTVQAIDVSNCTVWSTNNAKATSSFVLPAGAQIAVGGYLIVTRNRTTFLNDYGTYVDTLIVPEAASTTGTGVYIANNYSFDFVSATGDTIDTTTSTVSWNSCVYEKTEPTADGTIDANWYLTYQSTPVQGTPGAANSTSGTLDPPANVQISHDGTTVSISWDLVTGAISYYIYAGLTPDVDTTPGTQIGHVGTNAWSENVTPPMKYYKITASDDVPPSVK